MAISFLFLPYLEISKSPHVYVFGVSRPRRMGYASQPNQITKFIFVYLGARTGGIKYCRLEKKKVKKINVIMCFAQYRALQISDTDYSKIFDYDEFVVCILFLPSSISLYCVLYWCNKVRESGVNVVTLFSTEKNVMLVQIQYTFMAKHRILTFQNGRGY